MKYWRQSFPKAVSRSQRVSSTCESICLQNLVTQIQSLQPMWNAEPWQTSVILALLEWDRVHGQGGLEYAVQQQKYETLLQQGRRQAPTQESCPLTSTNSMGYICSNPKHWMLWLNLKQQLGIVALNCNPTLLKWRLRESGVQGQPWLHLKCKISLSYMRPPSHKQKKGLERWTAVKALAALAEDSNLVLSTQFLMTQYPLFTSRGTACMWYRCTCRWNTHTHKRKMS